MDCTICKKPIVLGPSAESRARKDKSGHPASYYASLFTTHSTCFIAKRATETVALMREIASKPKPYVTMPYPYK